MAAAKSMRNTGEAACVVSSGIEVVERRLTEVGASIMNRIIWRRHSIMLVASLIGKV